jgi:hypothetical protein
VGPARMIVGELDTQTPLQSLKYEKDRCRRGPGRTRSDNRLDVFRLLIEAGHEGQPVRSQQRSTSHRTR